MARDHAKRTRHVEHGGGFAGGSKRDAIEVRLVPLRESSRAFRDVEHDGRRGSRELIGQISVAAREASDDRGAHADELDGRSIRVELFVGKRAVGHLTRRAADSSSSSSRNHSTSARKYSDSEHDPEPGSDPATRSRFRLPIPEPDPDVVSYQFFPVIRS